MNCHRWLNYVLEVEVEVVAEVGAAVVVAVEEEAVRLI
jgi:hypothetical protein